MLDIVRYTARCCITPRTGTFYDKSCITRSWALKQYRNVNHMNDYLNYLSVIAQILGFPVAIISIAISLWLYQKSKQRRELSCTIDPIISPIEIKAGEAIKGEIEIRYQGEIVQNLFIVRVQLKNTGNVPIRKAEVVEPITFTFDKGTEFLREPRTIIENPSNLNSKWSLKSSTDSKNPNIAHLEFDLLNPEWETSAEFLCTGKSSLPSITAKIEGVLGIGQINYEEQRIRRRMKEVLFPTLLGTTVGGIAMFIIFAVTGAVEPNKYIVFFWLTLGAIGIMALLMTLTGYALIFQHRLSNSKKKKQTSK